MKELPRKKLKLKVLGCEVEVFARTEEDTVETAEEYLNKNSTICNTCREPIIPGMPIAISGHKEGDGNYQFTHGGFDCSIPGMFCGHWGEGEPVYMDWDKLEEEQRQERESEKEVNK